MTTTQVTTGTTAIQTPTPGNVQTVLKQLKEVAEVGQRLRGDPMNSFVRVSDLVNNNMARLVNGQLKPPATTASGGGGGGSGTVTSIATTSPITGGPITISGTIAHGVSGATAGSYTNANITIDTYGHVTAASDGSSGSSANITPDTHPASPTAWDDEFESGTSINTGKWTWENQLSGTAAVASGSLVLSSLVSTGADPQWVYQTPPTAPYTFVAKMFSAENNQAGMYIGIAGGKRIVFCIGSGAFRCYEWTSPTAYYTNVGGTVAIPNFVWPSAFNSSAAALYIMVEYDGTTINCYISASGVPGSFVSPVFTQTSASFIGATPNAIGLVVSQGAIGAIPAQGVFDWFRRTA